MQTHPPALNSAEGRWIITGMVLGSAATFLNATVVNIALPTIGTDLGADLAGLQWVVNGYLLTLSALILIGGSAGDIFGRRRVFLGGLALMVVGSVGAMAAPSLGWLIAARLLQGIGAAGMTPASLAIVDASFAEEERGKAVGLWASGSSFAAAAGPFLGGWLVDSGSWRWVFALNLPLAAGAAWATLRHVPESVGDRPGRHLDLPGAALAAVAIFGLVYGLVQGPGDGWNDPTVVASLALGVLASLGFAIRESRASDPMLPFRLFRSRQFSGTNALTLLMYFTIGGSFFFLALQLQVVSGYTASAAGAAIVPLSLLLIAGSPTAGRLSATYGPRWLLTIGPVVAGIGMLLYLRVGEDANYLTDVLPGVAVMGVGLAIMVAPLTATVLGSVAVADVGIASAVNNAIARTGGLLATAMLPFLAGVSTAAVGPEFAEGFRRAMVISAGLAFAGGIIGFATADRCVALLTTQQASPVSGCSQRSLPAEVEAKAA